MKFANVAIGVMLLGGLLAGTALAQIDAAYPTRSPQAYQSVPARQVAHVYNGDLLAAPGGPSASPSDMAVGSGYDSCDSCNSCYDPCTQCRPEAWSLFGETCSGIKVGGWISAGGYANEYNTVNNAALGFNNVGDGFTMNQLWGFIDKPVDTGGCGWDFGGRIDYVFGTDGPDTQAFGDIGWDTTWDSSRDYGSAIPQLYAEVGYDDWTLKAGHFFTPIGYEVVQAPQNFFYSHSHSFSYGEPLTHTGALATYSGFDNWTFHGGWTTGWDTGFNNTGNASTFLAGASYSLGDESAITYMASGGDWGAYNGGDVYMHSIVMESALSERLTMVVQSDFGVQSGFVVGDSRWCSINQYLLYEINDQLGIGMRFEWFDDRDGLLMPNGLRMPNNIAGSYYNYTAGVNWSPHPNFIFRPELRVDWFNGGTTAPNLPFNNRQRSKQFSGGFDAIFLF